MNINKIERNSIPPLGRDGVSPLGRSSPLRGIPPERDTIHEKEETILPSPPRVIKNAKISGKKLT